MRLRTWVLALAAAGTAGAAAPPVVFETFFYKGSSTELDIPPGHYRNPILPGFHPDPDVCRDGDDYYLVNSTFAYFPGIPVYHSRDLVNWTQVGSVVSRNSQLPYAGLGVSRGIFAPAISHHGSLFYLVCTFVDGGGNFLMTASNPAGPWSDPVWLGFDGIDPSLFFDDDGRAWIVNNGEPPGGKSLYNGHRAIWIQEFDPAALKLTGPRSVIVNAGVHPADHPVWIEGPHLFKKDGWYYLICAEGGTAEQHSEVVFRSRAATGPFEPGPANPILTQRELPDDRPNPVTCTGHADLFQAPGGSWWAVFLGCRPYAPGTYNTGRETFMLPVSWKDGWPQILPAATPVPLVVPSPGGASLEKEPPESPDDIHWNRGLSPTMLSPAWLGLRALPRIEAGSGLRLVPTAETLQGSGFPAFVGRRVQDKEYSVETRLQVPAAGVAAGLVLFQNETHYYFLAAEQRPEGTIVFVESANGGPARRIASYTVAGQPLIWLRATSRGALCDFQFSRARWGETYILKGADASVLSTRVAGGFVGAFVGLHARLEP